ncbi:hypothetical protein AVJ23_20035 [Pseudoponticoccus marisrubri]|uniref:ABC transporter ATP-binding protein n=2 Tax=Pseudoponticoccus marisrubri TaxID=1685382 RepID=A0A0W7WEI4_9RHOB|nr:hypothetical protein AVJ23_20035 [Pseudoponticoccus marisrubri]
MFMLLIYDRVLSSRSVETLVALFGLLLLLLLVLGTLDYARGRLLGRFGAQFQESLEKTLLEQGTRSQLFQRGGSKPAAGLSEADDLRGFVNSGSLVAMFDFFWTPLFLVVVYVLHPILGWICLGGVGVIAALVTVRTVFIGGRQERADRARGQVTTLRNHLIASTRTLRGQDMSPGFKARWRDSRDDARDHSIALKDWTGWFDSMSGIVVMVTRYSVLAAGAYFTLQGELTVGAMVAATFLVTRVLGPIRGFLVQVPRVFEARRQWIRLNRILDQQARELEDDAYGDQPGASHRLVVENLTVRSPLTNELVLRSVSMKVSEGELIEITGASSQGKTVLAECILGLWPKKSGKVLVNGRNIARLSDQEAQGLLGYAPETPGFVAGTIEENISGLDPDRTPEKVSMAARRARMHAAICALPDGYATVIDADGSGLSTFERNQLALARAMYHEPEILVIDALDSDMMVRIPKKLKMTFTSLMNSGTTIIVMSRQTLNLSYASRSFQLQDGKLIELKSDSLRSGSNTTPRKVSPIKPTTAEEDEDGGRSPARALPRKSSTELEGDRKRKTAGGRN